MSAIRFNQEGLVPVVVQDAYSKDVLMMAYMNEEALKRTRETKKATYYSRSKKRLWQKGETSGHTQHVKAIRYDCDEDALLLEVEQVGVACHTNHKSCFYRTLEGADTKAVASVFDEIEAVVKDRQANPKEGSYTGYLFDKGIDKILKKVGEETAETIIAAKNHDPQEIALEVSDLLYHLTVMLVERGVPLSAVYEELRKRREG